jgi:hypothetical protein
MKRTLRLAIFATSLALILTAAFAQTGPPTGKWKLNLEKSKYVPGPAPKSLTRTVEADGDKVKFTYEGVAGNGNAISYSFSVTFDGKDYPITGSGATGGADTIAVKQLGPRSFLSTLKKAGVPVAISKTEISADGKITTQHVSSPDGKGPINNTAVYDKQP